MPAVTLTDAHEDWLVPYRGSQASGGPVVIYASRSGADALSLSASAGCTTWDPSGLYEVSYPGSTLTPAQVGIGTPDENDNFTVTVDLAAYESATVTLYGGRECPPNFSPKVYCQARLYGDWGSYTNELWAQLPYILQVTDIGAAHEAIVFTIDVSDYEELGNPVLQVYLYANGGAGTSAKLTAVSLDAVPLPPSLAVAPAASGSVAMSFPTESGKTYTLQTSTDLMNPAAWSNVPAWTDIPGNGSTMTASPPVQGHGLSRLSVSGPD